ncbi:hypothetical protein A7982_13963 [Minicystis rosea]|nr:hypothetical protein A7982_13963 [Minicystis rosea]
MVLMLVMAGCASRRAGDLTILRLASQPPLTLVAVRSPFAATGGGADVREAARLADGGWAVAVRYGRGHGTDRAALWRLGSDGAGRWHHDGEFFAVASGVDGARGGEVVLAVGHPGAAAGIAAQPPPKAWCFDADGTLRWQVAPGLLEHAQHAEVAVIGELAIVVTARGVSGLALADGRERWFTPHAQPAADRRVLVHRGRLLVAGAGSGHSIAETEAGARNPCWISMIAPDGGRVLGHVELPLDEHIGCQVLDLAAVGEHLVLRVADYPDHRKQAVGGKRFVVLDGRDAHWVAGYDELETLPEQPLSGVLGAHEVAFIDNARGGRQVRLRIFDVASHSQRAEVVLASERWQIDRAHDTDGMVGLRSRRDASGTMTLAGGFDGRMRTSDGHIIDGEARVVDACDAQDRIECSSRNGEVLVATDIGLAGTLMFRRQGPVPSTNK